MTLGENSFSVVGNIAMNMIVPRLTCIQNKSIESNFSFVFHGGRRIFSLKIKPNYSIRIKVCQWNFSQLSRFEVKFI